MEARVIFHPLVQQDMDGVLSYYSEEASVSVADRFFQTFLRTVDRALFNPQGFHFANRVYRRADVAGFPYHFLYREMPYGIRILVLRHDRRHPSFGMKRQ
ncbi:type II toxin-antitoxin system RelE/ParE family toxin [Phragmitibacter flavus]|uniref:Type II toxin-antitoxin system RelE/ParE family toxin n=1 Tax=Phragmitibacter flavus TaxID=2576071 RepID=A0A5R8KEC4_9BACT|nr:type II toxin-antitoxin system RelE/ParE family toxin [Phragmitibacter flavus]